MELLSSQIYVRNLYIGGGSLERHVGLLESEEKAYVYQHNGENCRGNTVSLKDALSFEKWDYITIQQASGYSGMEDTYYPYIQKLIDYVKQFSNAEIFFHQTWAYEKNAKHPDFEIYQHSHDIMWEYIRSTTSNVCKKWGLRIIPTGEIIESLKTQRFFDIDQGGISIHRDGYHLSLNYGRFAAACVWIKFFTGEIPSYLKREDLSEGYKLILKEIEAYKVK